MKSVPGRSYLDWNATAPLRPEALAAIAEALAVTGNPSSVHAEGRQARSLVEAARGIIARALGASPTGVIFTSGGTEANLMALQPGLVGSGGAVQRLLVSAIEHASVLSGGSFSPAQIESVPVTPDGVLDLAALASVLDGPPALVSIMLANNETGVLQPIREAARLVHQAGGILHVDAVQAFGKIPIDMKELEADLLTLSAHKLGGPKGIGAVVLADTGLGGFSPVIRGGGQERNRRAGTENVAGIAGFGAATEAAMAGLGTEMTRLMTLRDQLECGLGETQGAVVAGHAAPRLPNTTLVSLPGLRAETAVIAFDLEGIAVSSGAACSSGKVQPSHVLAAMGAQPEVAGSAIRISLGYATKDEDIQRCIQAWIKLSEVLPKG